MQALSVRSYRLRAPGVAPGSSPSSHRIGAAPWLLPATILAPDDRRRAQRRTSAALPIPQLVIGWLVIVVLGSLIGGQAITRPVYRSGRVSPARRWLQGFGVVVYTLAVHAVAVWGATIFATQQSNPGLATLSFMLFGVNILVVGIFAVINTLS